MDIDKEIRELELVLADLRSRRFSDEKMVIREIDGKLRYYKVTKSGEEYLNSAKKDEIAALEEKYYIQRLTKTVISNQNELKKLRNKYKPLEQVFLEIPGKRRHLIKPYVMTSDKTVRKIIRKLDNSSYVTQAGEYVRSKSEVIIADRLKSCGVPYCYEPNLKIDYYEVWHPDFMALNKNTGKVYYWEHFGMLDDQEYRQSFHYKLEKYAENGIFLGDNLIITSETYNHQLNTKYVDRLIKHFLLA